MVLSGRAAAAAARVKVCGVMHPADAGAAHAAGADLLGMVFAPGARRVDHAASAPIRAAVPEARLCGVFLDQQLDDITAAAEAADLDLIQLHGGESPSYCRAVASRTGLPLIKALTADQVDTGTAARYDAAAYFLVDLPKNVAAAPATNATEDRES